MNQGAALLRRATRLVALTGALMLAAACNHSGSSSLDAGEFGAVVPTAEELAGYPKALPANAFPSSLEGAASASAAPASFVIPESILPPVQAQGTAEHEGSPGSCEVWSAGYAMGSYVANLTNQRNIKDLANTVSAASVYVTVLAEEQKSCGEGTAAPDTLNLLVKNQAPSLAAIPYYPTCECPTGSDQCLDAIAPGQWCATNREFCSNLSIGSWSALAPLSHDEVLKLIKTWIAQRRIVQTSIIVPIDFVSYASGVYSAPSSCDGYTKCALHRGIACIASPKTNTGCAQHGVAVVGYDDELGALRIQNSFGTTWGESGYMWMSYATFEAIYLSGTIAFPPPARDTRALAGRTSAAAEAGFQWVDERDATSPRVHLIFAATLDEPLAVREITIRTPDGRSLTHDYGGHWFVHGHHYVTRHDGRQFAPGRYDVRLAGTTVAGEERVVESSVEVALAPDAELPVAPPGDDVTGTNGLPVR